MLSETWLKDKRPCLVFVNIQIQRVLEEKADDDIDQESDASD